MADSILVNVQMVSKGIQLDYGDPKTPVIIQISSSAQKTVVLRVKPLQPDLSILEKFPKTLPEVARLSDMEPKHQELYLADLKTSHIRQVANIDLVNPRTGASTGPIDGTVTMVISLIPQDYADALNQEPWPWYVDKKSNAWKPFTRDEAVVETHYDTKQHLGGSISIIFSQYMDPTVGVDSRSR